MNCILGHNDDSVYVTSDSLEPGILGQVLNDYLLLLNVLLASVNAILWDFYLMVQVLAEAFS